MKSYLSLLTAALLGTSALNAADIVIYKGTYTEKETEVVEENYDTAGAVGLGSKVTTVSYKYYLIMDLTNQDVLRVSYQTKPSKLFKVVDPTTDTPGTTPADLSQIFQVLPLKPVGTVQKSLWSSTQDLQFFAPVGYKSSIVDIDTDTQPDLQLNSTSAYVTGTGGPFTVTKTPVLVQIQGIPTKLTGPTYSLYAERLSNVAAKDQAYSVYSGTQTLTLDSTLTKAANLSPILPTVDVGYGTASINAGLMANGVQQASNALKKLGFSLGNF
jgi:hypothetical protein